MGDANDREIAIKFINMVVFMVIGEYLLEHYSHLFRMFAVLSAQYAFYRIELKHCVKEGHGRFIWRYYTLYRNIILTCIIKVIVELYIAHLLDKRKKKVFQLKQKHFNKIAMEFLCCQVVIKAFEFLLKMSFLMNIVESLKCLSRVNNAYNSFFRSVRTKWIYRKGKFGWFIYQGLFNGVSTMLTNSIVKVLFRGKIPIAGWTVRVLTLTLLPLGQYWVNSIEFGGGDRHHVVDDFGIVKYLTIVFALTVENYAYVLTIMINKLVLRKSKFVGRKLLDIIKTKKFIKSVGLQEFMRHHFDDPNRGLAAQPPPVDLSAVDLSGLFNSKAAK